MGRIHANVCCSLWYYWIKTVLWPHTTLWVSKLKCKTIFQKNLEAAEVAAKGQSTTQVVEDLLLLRIGGKEAERRICDAEANTTSYVDASCYLAVPFPIEKDPTKKITDFNGLLNKKNGGQLIRFKLRMRRVVVVKSLFISTSIVKWSSGQWLIKTPLERLLENVSW
ncbi:hypothetical protein Tco_1501684 [Tanacetum coccineum]